MEYYGDFGSSMSEHSWTGQQGGISRPAEFSIVRERLATLGDHQLFDERSAPGYKHQTFEKTEQVFDTMSNHTYPQQDHPCHYHQFASSYFTISTTVLSQHSLFLTISPTTTTPKLLCTNSLPTFSITTHNVSTISRALHELLSVPFDQGARMSTFPSWHPQLLVQQEGTAEHAPLLFHSRPTETVQPHVIQGASAVTNCQVIDYALDMECQQVPSVHATSNETDCLTKNEQQPHHGIETQSISDMLDHIQAQLKTISENLCQNLKRMNSWESKQSVATQAIGVAPVCCSKTNNTAGSETKRVNNLQEPIIVQDYHNGAIKMHVSVEVKQESEQPDKCLHKASPTTPHEQVGIWKQSCDLDIKTGRSLKLDTENCIIEFSVVTSSLPFQQEQLHQVHTREYNLMLTAKGIQEWDPGILTPSSMYLWLQGLTARIATEKPLSWLPIPELTKWQSQVTSASFVWDPGIMLLSYKCKWWLLYTEEKINWLTEIKYYGVALWLIHFQPP